MQGRAMYIWRLKPVVNAEGSVTKIVEKARRAKLSELWIKIADGASVYSNLEGTTGDNFRSLITKCHDQGIRVWGWQVPHAATAAAARAEADTVRDILGGLSLDGIIMDAEGGAEFFKGGLAEAKIYAAAMRQVCDDAGKPLAISSNDIPHNIGGWLPRFDEIAAVADFNAPQVYYGSSPSVLNRLTRAEDANSHIASPFIPVGAAWIGDGGGCASASATAERGREFIRLVKDRGYVGYSFWHWAGAPMAFWEMLNTTAV